MRFIIKKDYDYFCCSTFPLLNGDIKMLIFGNHSELIGDKCSKTNVIYLKDMLNLILTFLVSELKEGYKKKSPRKIKVEYKRMIRLYKFRIKELEDS